MNERVLNVDWDLYSERLAACDSYIQRGRLTRMVGLVAESEGPSGEVGELCTIHPASGAEPIPCQIVGFRDGRVLLMPMGDTTGIAPGAEVIAAGHPPVVAVGEALVGRILDGLGRPMDGGPPLELHEHRRIDSLSPPPLQRKRISEVLSTGIRALDGLLTCGKGQRLGIFSGSGVGKSTLLGMIARYCSADVNVIALIGERGREVKDFIERDLGEEGLARSVVVAATGDQPALVRLSGAKVAMTIAEYFRDQGKDVNLMLDNVTRMAFAQREVGLSAGEPPTTRGYTPSVFSMLPRFLERAGILEGQGSITGLFTVLVEADDMNEPIADAVRAILDGHVVLSRQLANRNHYPCVDVLGSVSRVMIDITSTEVHSAAQRVRETLAVYSQAEDLINIGAYSKGSNRRIDKAIAHIEKINDFLRQGIFEHEEFDTSIERLLGLVEEG
jgi:flagellum-specific ATP synthase